MEIKEMGEKKESILDILMEERLYNALEVLLLNNKEYQTVQKELQETIDKLEEMGLNKEQDMAVDRVLSVTNQSSAMYGAAAYRQGFYDGIKLMAELEQINCADDLPKGYMAK